MSTTTYGIEDIAKINLENFPNDNLGWAIAERFPTAEYREIKQHCSCWVSDLDEETDVMCAWQEDENYADYIDMAAFNEAPIRFYILLDGDSEANDIKILLSAKTQEDIDYIVSIVEETHSPKEVKTISE